MDPTVSVLLADSVRPTCLFSASSTMCLTRRADNSISRQRNQEPITTMACNQATLAPRRSVPMSSASRRKASLGALLPMPRSMDLDGVAYSDLHRSGHRHAGHLHMFLACSGEVLCGAAITALA